MLADHPLAVAVVRLSYYSRDGNTFPVVFDMQDRVVVEFFQRAQSCSASTDLSGKWVESAVAREGRYAIGDDGIPTGLSSSLLFDRKADAARVGRARASKDDLPFIPHMDRIFFAGVARSCLLCGKELSRSRDSQVCDVCRSLYAAGKATMQADTVIMYPTQLPLGSNTLAEQSSRFLENLVTIAARSPRPTSREDEQKKPGRHWGYAPNCIDATTEQARAWADIVEWVQHVEEQSYARGFARGSDALMRLATGDTGLLSFEEDRRRLVGRLD